ncbi:MAG: ACT domain-containing protein [Verrucomicrobia bacterium]|nr:ACT domain-containing protein [Verrucomicrobiota bacterium]
MKCQITTQLSVFLANKPGTLADVCETLAAEGVNIFAMTISDTVDHAVVRLICSDPRKALAVFEERGTLVVDQQVLTLEEKNRPGALALIARKFAKHGVNIEYAYCASGPSAKTGLVVLRPSDIKRGLRALTSK